MTFNTALRALRAHLVALLVLAAAGLAIAAIVLALLPRTYESTAQIWVRSEEGAEATTLMPSVLEFAQSHTVSDAAAKRLGGGADASSVEAASEVEVPAGSSIITITSTGSSPKQAARTAEAMTAGLDSSLKHTDPTKGAVTLVTTQEAKPEPKAVSPDPWAVLLSGLVIGLVVGALWAVWRGPRDGHVAPAAATGEVTG